MKSKSKNANPIQPDPIQQSVHVDCPVEDAFRLFTEGFGKWWPLANSNGSDAGASSCEIEPWEGGRVLERSARGVEREWGEVRAWNPPRNLEFTWNPGRPRDDRQVVSVEFEEEADGARVTLTHRGWQYAGVAVCVSGSEASATHLVHGLAISRVRNWKPVAIGREYGADGTPANPVGFGKREAAWRNSVRPTWADVFVNCFAEFAAEDAPAAV
jgi:uncharacterized protein YndB with AHSA1/START domain